MQNLTNWNMLTLDISYYTTYSVCTVYTKIAGSVSAILIAEFIVISLFIFIRFYLILLHS
jgi:hypothetical protein